MLKVMKTLLMLLLLSSCSKSVVKEVVVVTPSKFGVKVRNLHETIVITKPGVYDYEGVMHIWKGGGVCNFFHASQPVMEIRSDGVTVKNFGFKEAKGGITIVGGSETQARKNVTIKNVEGTSCYKPLDIPERSVNLRVEESILLKE